MKKVCKTIVMFGLAAFLFLTTASIAPAQEAGPLYVGIFGGYVMPRDLEIGSFEVKMENSWAAGAKVGYILPQLKFLSFEVEYTHLGKQDFDQPLFPGELYADTLMANALVRYPQGIIHPFAGFGLGASRGDLSGPFGYSDSATGFAWQLIAGVNLEITKNLSADLAYRYFQAEWDIERGFNDSTVTSKNHMILLGINFHF